MSAINEELILETLKGIKDDGEDIVTKGMVAGLQIKDGHIAFAIEVDAERGAQMEPLRKEAEQAVHALDGVLSVTVVLTAERQGDSAAAASAPAQ